MTPPQKNPTETPRLNLKGKTLLGCFILIFVFIVFMPRLWNQIETFSIGPDYRIPYALSKDYGLYQRRLQRMEPHQIPLLGDSVIWGEYVARDGTLPHFLNEETGQPDRFVNASINGLFPLAMEGLLRHYGQTIRNQKVILHFNPLWMTSPESDLSSPKEQKFNHARLVPQFTHKIPCYRAPFNDKASIVITRPSTFFAWVAHLQNAYFEQQNLYAWTLADDHQYPPAYPNATANPLKQITLTVPEEPKTDPHRGVASPRHKPWSTTGIGTQQFPWVPPDQSIQWHAFQRIVKLLGKRGNHVLVIMGPFNTHIMTAENRVQFEEEIRTVQSWLDAQGIATLTPDVLTSPLYGDSSHPLTEGYRQLARHIASDPSYQAWIDSQ